MRLSSAKEKSATKRKNTWFKKCLETFKGDKVVKAAAIICFAEQTFNEIVIISVHFKLLYLKWRTRDLGPLKHYYTESKIKV